MNKAMRVIEERRDATYQAPERRCETCSFFWAYSDLCQLVYDRGRVKSKKVIRAGCCEMWARKEET